MRTAYIIACVTLSMAALPAAAQAQPGSGEWVSYRDAYRALVVFDKYGGPKHLLQQHLQVVPRNEGVLAEGVQMRLHGKTVQLNLPLDRLGRMTLPLLKAAYDDNAALSPSRALGGFKVRTRVSLVVRADGSYDAAELRAGCQQALDYARHTNALARNVQCVGVRLVYAASNDAVEVRAGVGAARRTLPWSTGPAFAGDGDTGSALVNYRFGAAGEQVVTKHAPLAIVPLIE